MSMILSVIRSVKVDDISTWWFMFDAFYLGLLSVDHSTWSEQSSSLIWLTYVKNSDIWLDFFNAFSHIKKVATIVWQMLDTETEVGIHGALWTV